MRISHALLAIFVMAIWGFSFVAIGEGLRDMPPLLLCSLRFFFTCLPAIFFIPKPDISWSIIIRYGLLMFVLMFSCTFWGIHAGVTPGLASLIMQLQVFFTMFLSMIIFKEHLSKLQILGALISLSGLAVVGRHIGGTLTLTGLCLIIAAAVSWSFANLTTKQAGKINMLSLIVWSSLIAFPLLFVLSLVLEGVKTDLRSLEHISEASLISVLYMAYPATVLGFSAWAWLLSQHRAGTIAPFALLVPCFGMLGSILIFHESLDTWKLVAAALIISGLAVNLLSSHILFFIRHRILNEKIA